MEEDSSAIGKQKLVQMAEVCAIQAKKKMNKFYQSIIFQSVQGSALTAENNNFLAIFSCTCYPSKQDPSFPVNSVY